MKVELSLHATKLKNAHSSPYAVVTHVSTQAGMTPTVLGRTETIANTANPNWSNVIVMDYQLGAPMTIAVQIYNDKKSLGTSTFDIGECLGARGNTKAKPIKHGGTIFARVAQSQGTGHLALGLKGIQLKNVEGFMGKSDPYYELSCKTDAAGGQTWNNVFRSNVVKNNLNPIWNMAVVELSPLCQGDVEKPILISVYDFESNGKHVPMGQVVTTVKALSLAASPLVLVQKGKQVGTLVVTTAEIMDPSTPRKPGATLIPSSLPTFVDYISGGCELNVVVAIDFTGSNGDIHQPSSLHYVHPNGALNDYEKATNAIVSILAKYDSDQMYPVYGFGADLGRGVDHCFQVGPTPEVHGVRGVLDAYRQFLKSKFQLNGPTDFSEVIQTAAARATSQQDLAKSAGKQAYTILLIVTDGVVTDVPKNAHTIQQCANAPMSIVIVGVGKANFSGMRMLDDHAGKPDIAQFVPFQAHCSNSVALTTTTLQEIPSQLVGYFQRHGIQPLVAIPPPVDEDIVVDMEEEEIDLSLSFQEDGEIVVASGGVCPMDGFRA